MSSDSSDSSDRGRISPTLLLPETLDLPAIPDPEPREILQDLSPDFRCDGISSVVALAFHLDVPVLDGTVIESASGTGARIGSGAIATVALTRLTRDVQQKYRRRTELEMIRPGLVSASWLGRDYTAGQRTVVKRFFTDDRSRDELAIAEISQELRILGHKHIWQNRNVVDIIGLDWERNPFDILDGPYRFPVLLLEYGDCGTLEDFFRLEGIEYTWDVKVDLLYDIANGLETISDAGVCHGDLKLTNVLVFRNGNTSFVAKLCDFGSAVTSINVEVGTTFRLKSVTPPWDAPESTADIDIDDIDKVDFYGYGLIACRVALEGGDPFAIALSETPAASDPVARNDVIKAWKTQDKVSEICKSAIRHAPGIHYTQTQHETLSNLIDNTARTRLDLRADEYREIRALLKPEEVTKEDDWGPENVEMSQVMWDRIIPPLFNSNWRESIPSIHHCWARLPPAGALASQIFKEIRELASCPPAVRLRPGWESRAAEAEYATAICLIQGFGCDQDTSLGCDRLIQSVASHCNRAMKCIFRILAALGKDLPEEHREMVALTARKAAIMSCDKRQMQDLAQLDSKLYDETMEELRTNQEQAMEVFGCDLFMKWDIQDCDFIWETNAGRNTEIEDDGVAGTKLTWLHYAASRGWASLVERLIKSPGCDLNCVTDDGHWTPIFMACQGGHYDVVILLLKNGADPAIKSTTGDCCIHHLQRFGSEVVGDIAKQLVSRGIGVDSRSGLTGLTPLATACNLGTAPDSMDWISTLVDLGADVLLEGDDGFTPIDIVTTQLEPELLDILLRSSLLPEEKKSVACAKALYCLIRQPYFKRMEYAGSAYQDTLRSIVDILVSPPVLAAYETLHGSRNVLYDACRWGAADLIPLLLDRGFPVDDPRPQESPPLFGAIRSGHVGIAATLIDRGADIATTDFHGRNILHVVAALLPSFLSNILTQLENRGCNLRRLVNAGTVERGFTPFDEAVQAENFDCANSILKLGAQYTEFTRRSGPGLDFDYPLSSSLFHAATSRTQLSYMLRLDPRPSMVVAENGMTIFHIMAACFDIWSSYDTSPANNVAFLLDHFVTHEDAARSSADGATPLHLAALTLNVAVAEVLLEVAGVDVNPVDEKGTTPLDQLIIHEVDKEDAVASGCIPIANEIDQLRPKSDMEAHLIRGRLKAMRELLLKHGGVSGKDLK